MPETCPHFPNGLSPLERAGKLWRDLEEHRDPTERGAVEWADLRPIERRFYVSCVSELIFHNDLIQACLRELADDDGEDGESKLAEELELHGRVELPVQIN